MTILVTGGSGSGKSVFAEGLVPRLEAHGRIYLATMEAEDGESRRRVMRHRAQREGLGMRTLERARDMDGAEIPQGSLVLLEDLPNLLANRMFGGGTIKDHTLKLELERLADAAESLILVSGDIFRDGMHYDEKTEEYIEYLGDLHRWLAGKADRTVEVVCGIPISD